jgi:hypothetical protein
MAQAILYGLPRVRLHCRPVHWLKIKIFEIEALEQFRLNTFLGKDQFQFIS